VKPTRVSTGTPWEAEVGYARAVRIGDSIAVSGTVAAGADGRPVAEDAYGQAREIFRILDGVLRRLGSRLESVLRLRVHYADPAIGPGFTRALKEAFPDGAPALTGLRVTGLVEPDFLLEVEADAVAGEWRSEAPPVPEWDEGVD
jgi:enamine deaminase RidA (YjgF/YER057c/UK114 family)